jgi:hypothetical protein
MNNKIALIGWPCGTRQVIIKGQEYDEKHHDGFMIIGEGMSDEEALTNALENLISMKDEVTNLLNKTL